MSYANSPLPRNLSIRLSEFVGIFRHEILLIRCEISINSSMKLKLFVLVISILVPLEICGCILDEINVDFGSDSNGIIL